MRYAARQVGLISDTHGLLRPQALAALAGAELILHAGDIGSIDVLERLRAVAPVLAVRGNNDVQAWADGIPETIDLWLAGARVHLLHDVKALRAEVRAGDVRLVIAGHSHRPRVERRKDVLFLNPGSAGPRRFGLPATVAWLDCSGGRMNARIVALEV
jgi:putative phosphoesterase